VLFTSSIASTMPGSFQTVYNASKSSSSPCTALHNELKDSGVTITALMPGPTDTEFFARAEMLDRRSVRVRRTTLPMSHATAFGR
jgi:short-subunit dehydrogenase